MAIIANPNSLSLAAKHLASHDPVLAPIIDRTGVAKIAPHQNYYQELVESIISQQLSVKAAATILKRFTGLFATSNFPTPQQILEKDVASLRSAGLSRQKAGYIQDLASKILAGMVSFDQLDELSNTSVIDELTKIKGVGVWTSHMFLIFCMGHLDILPIGDLGIKNGIQSLYKLAELPTTDDIKQIAANNKWHPYESIACWYIWQSLDNKPTLQILDLI